VTRIVLDRMELEESGYNAARLAASIHRQLGSRPGRVEVHEIAKALDILEIRTEPLEGIEAALITLPDRGYGSILVNANSSPQRRRFSVGHELLHFLHFWHEPSSTEGFHCTRQDMIERNTISQDDHRRQEAEANEFAIELLAPDFRVRPFLETKADLNQALAMASELDISREASVRRYVALHDEPLAAVFVINGRLRYAELGPDFPDLGARKGEALPSFPTGVESAGPSTMEEVDADDWLKKADGGRLSAQTLVQRDGYAIILLKAQLADAEEAGGDLEDVYDRFERTWSPR